MAWHNTMSVQDVVKNLAGKFFTVFIVVRPVCFVMLATIVLRRS